MAKLYGEGSGSRRICPGEGDGDKIEPCVRWLTAGETAEERDHACAACDVCHGRTPGSVPPEQVQEESDLLKRIERLYYEQKVGLLRPETLTIIEEEGLLRWCAQVDMHEREHMRQVAFLFEVLMIQMKLKAAGM